MVVENTTEFYRLWSALQFVCCLPTGDNELSNHELFGDGLFWAGCTIMHFLNQQMRFEVFDFSYHILNVEEGSPNPCANPVRHISYNQMLTFFFSWSINSSRRLLLQEISTNLFSTLWKLIVPHQLKINWFCILQNLMFPNLNSSKWELLTDPKV